MRRRFVLGVGALVLVLYLFRDPLSLAVLRHRPAPRPDPSAEPAQTLNSRAPFEHLAGGRRYRITPRYHWDQSAEVVGARPYRWGATGALIPEDLALAWGPVLRPPFVGKISYSQYTRFYFWRTKDLSLDRGAIVSHSANVHIIPRSLRVRSAARSLSKGDLVRLEGWLVDVDGIDDTGFHWGTSATREDEGPGSCETVYLERLTVGERAYE
jgi:hypothetical protein